MKVIGLITEYNPFHNGHKYQIDQIKKMYPESIIICVTSSSFTQRGEISILDKWTKTNISLKAGIDLVIELPFVFSTESADTFAYASVYLLNELKIDTLVFGSESDNVSMFKELASHQINNNEFDIKVKELLDKGYNYPTALSKALESKFNTLIVNPNDLLAVSYSKAVLMINEDIELVSIKRTNDYHDIDSNDTVVSASNIRNKMINNEDIKKYVPSYSYEYLKNIKIDTSKMFDLLKYKINTEKDLSIYQTVDEGIENRLIKYINCSNNYEEFVENIKTKRYTYNKINRMLIHILVCFTKKDKELYKKPNYIRVLGMNNTGKEYLSKIKKEINLPLISKFDKDLLDFEYKVSVIYSMLVNNPSLIEQEYKNKIQGI